MTISAQVIDTIVEWIDDNLNQPLRIDDIARHVFLGSIKAKASGVTFGNASCYWPRAIYAIPTRKCTTSV